MIYTIIFYLLIAIITFNGKSNALKWSCIVLAFYCGLRYDYMPDYMHYYNAFNEFANANYIYDSDYSHYEYGWYLLNKIFSPLGFFAFVFICSSVFAYGVFCVIDCFNIDRKLLPIVLIGYSVSPSVAVLCSAQRQFVVASIFMIAYKFLLHDNIGRKRALYSPKYLLYYLTILICSTLHSSAVFLLLIPLVGLIPYGSKKYMIVSIIIFLAFIVFGETYLPLVLNHYIEKTETYEYMDLDKSDTSGGFTYFAILNIAFQVLFLSYTLTIKRLSNQEKCVVLLAFLALSLNISIHFVPQLYRISMYISLFTFIAIPIIYQNISCKYRNIYLFAMWIFIVWTALKVFQPAAYSWAEYKTIFSTI